MKKLFRAFVLLCFVFVSVLFFAASDAGDEFVKVSDISYRQERLESDYARTQCKLDIYYPKNIKSYPTIVWFHGGSLKTGTRNWGIAFAKRFTAEGIGVVLVSYRFSPKVKNPVYSEDAAAAVAWTFKNIANYGGDPEKVFISGHSAGGYLAAIVGMDERYLEKHNMSVQKIAGIIPISGQMVTHTTILEERGIPKGAIIIDEFSPLYHLRKVGPACLCICGDNDIPLRCDENIFFIAGLKSAGNKNAHYLEVKGRNHNSLVAKFHEEDDEVTHAMLEFIRKLQ
ncbi:MAG: alpha/beta hydrolase [Candidatus Aminicenantes bacterium]|jgi:acetyl esterase/lipase